MLPKTGSLSIRHLGDHMPVRKENGCLWITHSRYYSQWVGNLPYAPYIYWNVHTDDNIIPVCTYGYKTLKSAQKQIASYVSDVKEYRMIHMETEEECKVRRMKLIEECRNDFKEQMQ
jgi:hypothetical protein